MSSLIIPSIRLIIRRAVTDQELWHMIRKEFPDSDDDEILKELYSSYLKSLEIEEKNETLESEVVNIRGEMTDLFLKMEKLEKEKKRLIMDLNKKCKGLERWKEEVNNLRKRMENTENIPETKCKVILKDDAELVEKLRKKNEKIKHMDHKHQNRIFNLETENRELRKQNEFMNNKLNNIERTHYALVIRIPINPMEHEPEVDIIDSQTYFLHKNDPRKIFHMETIDGWVYKLKLLEINATV